MSWPPEARSIIGGDVVAACATATRFGGTNLFPVSPMGQFDEAAGTVTFTSPLALCRKIDDLRRDPKVALAFFTRSHGLSEQPGFVLVQGDAEPRPRVDPADLASFDRAYPDLLGSRPTSRLGRWASREYLEQRVRIDVHVTRLTYQPGPVRGLAPQRPPRQVGGARWSPRRVRRRLDRCADRVLAWLDDDGYPDVRPVPEVSLTDEGLRFAPGTVPAGGRRASFLGYWCAPRLEGQGALQARGWLDDDTLVVSGSSGFDLPRSTLAPKLIVPLAVKAKHRSLARRGLIEGDRWVGQPYGSMPQVPER